MLLKTPLNPLHHALHARMVDFGGWEMPLHYGSQIEEHHAVRQRAGVFDVSHMRAVDMEGPGTAQFLRGLLANNVDKLKQPGKALYSCLLNEVGCVLDDLIVYQLGPDRYRLVVNAGTANKDIAWFISQRNQRQPAVMIAPRPDLAMLAVQGPQARDQVWAAIPGAQAATEALKPFSAAPVKDCFIARTGYTGEDGFEILLPATEAAALWQALLDAGVAPAGLGARDTLRLEAGMNLYGQDMDETVTPLESGLTWTVDLSGPRDFIGKAALLAQHPARQLIGLVLLDRGVLRGHQVVRTPHGDGEITSGGFAPTLNQSIALARLPAAVVVGDEVQVSVRDKWLRARVVKPPFVRHGKALV